MMKLLQGVFTRRFNHFDVVAGVVAHRLANLVENPYFAISLFAAAVVAIALASATLERFFGVGHVVRYWR